ncbi:hypothetical protein G5C60_31340 [Streptomyces sp. HC44]|uniref:Uncharacterized protein n=1 Tax=Streptomyces scabichelini TaxID=2711217 RepID=A0A6G4VD08_9ACTN|nr:hypothetical protein [Streptomyces scabichelini]NGO11979.1 hypothetical protein [Streptomyces scabichelini]
MSESPSNQTVQENDLPRYRVELESVDEGIRRGCHVHAGSMEEALLKVREGDQWPSSGPGSDPSRFRVVEASEESASSEARHQRNARRRYLNTIVETGLTALGKSAPDHSSDEEFFDVLCDFFTRAVVLPGHFAFPSGDTEGDRLMSTDDAAAVMAQLLTTHLAHHGLKVTETLPEPE